jgi:disease resistance protein RPS2
VLLELSLHNNTELRKIPPSFFDCMTALQTLNLSKTGVRSLLESVFRLVFLKRLFLSYCHRFMRLSPKVGELKQLEVLDLEGTEIMYLPEEIMKLTNLTCLKFSIYGYMGDSSGAMQSDAPVPRNVISALSRLKELKISVNPDDKQWYELMAEDIIVTEVCNLNLKTLHLFFPSTDLVENFILNSRMWKHPSELLHFRFTVGHHVKRIMPRLPREAELELEKWDRCLKYTNGVTVPSEIKEVLQYSTAFFLERHESVKKLSDFGIGNMKKLKCCVVGECNEVEVITDGADARDREVVLEFLQYLCIYYMKNLRSIWRGPLRPWSLYFLKYLTLRTCPRLTTIFTEGIIDRLCNLEELTVDDCPSITTIVSCETSAEIKTSYHFLPTLKRMSLHYVPELISISSGLKIARYLEWLSSYNCPKLQNLWNAEESWESLTRIEGERSWWEALEWRRGRPSYLDEIFVPINKLDC